MMLCVGAVSRRVVEEAAQAHVHQVVASRRQVDVGGGYTGLDQGELVELVRKFSDGATEVVRDHGGPLQGATPDDGVASLEADVRAGFDGLHLDVCKIDDHDEQRYVLLNLITRFADSGVRIEVGGEHTRQDQNVTLLRVALRAGVIPSYVVLNPGTYVWADSQCGTVVDVETLGSYRLMIGRTALTRAEDVRVKMHNADWVGNRERMGTWFDAYNVAPELGCLEVDALLTTVSFTVASELLNHAYDSMLWRRWFNTTEGTYDRRARCALRYMLETDPLVNAHLGIGQLDERRETYVRRVIRDAIDAG